MPKPSDIARTMVLQALEEGRVVRLGFMGPSMSPLLRPGDGIRVGPLPPKLRVGDIVLYPSGETLVAHRVLQLAPAGEANAFVVKGDFSEGGAEILQRSKCLGLVLSRERRGITLYLRSPFHLLLGRLLALASPWAVKSGLALPRPMRKAMKWALFRLFGVHG